MRRIIVCILGCLLLAMPVQAAERYVALGDSLAAGQTPNRMIDAGYTDFIALRLASRGELAHFSKELAFSGFTTEQVLERVQEPFAQPLLQQATLITISAGANDLLRLVNVNAQTGDVTFDQLTADFALNNVRQNIAKTIDELRVRAPKADVFVIGYYFPYPHVHDAQKEGLAVQLQTLNTILQQQAEAHGVTFIDVASRYGMDATNYLPNATDVHPNFEGYMAMANAFLAHEQMRELTVAQLPTPKPLTFEQVLQQLQQTQQQQEQQLAAAPIESYVVPHGFRALERLYTVR